MPERKFDLGDYVEVKDRIKLFYELYGQGRLVTGEVRLSNEPDGVARVLVQGLAYRTPDDPLPGVGWSWMELPGKTTYTKGSELENTETSAWGRAIGSLGILIDRSIASAQEVDNKQDDGRPAPPHLPARTDAASADPPPPPKDAEKYAETEELLGRLRKTGVVRKGTSAGYKLEARQGPDGHVIGFKLDAGDKGVPQCIAAGPLGESLFLATAGHPEVIAGKQATVAGILYYVKSNRSKDGWYRLKVDRYEDSDWILPADEDTSQPPEALPETGLFSEDEQKRLDAALEATA